MLAIKIYVIAAFVVEMTLKRNVQHNNNGERSKKRMIRFNKRNNTADLKRMRKTVSPT